AQSVFMKPFREWRVFENGEFLMSFDGEGAMELTGNTEINSTGVSAPAGARRLTRQPTEHIPTAYNCKEIFSTFSARSPLSRLIYPMSDHAVLCVQLTLDLGSHAKFGPDTEWVDSETYKIDPCHADAFYAAVRQY